ncbi:hypothetical protein SUGI_0453400 [Cryptomeria japonica]|nr:hypothetical protein SUGI_0453400 [Cryptomeria japonica]
MVVDPGSGMRSSGQNLREYIAREDHCSAVMFTYFSLGKTLDPARDSFSGGPIRPYFCLWLSYTQFFPIGGLFIAPRNL